jgi:outer membrane protein OmpA-like peptidoglycan-associated protein
MFDTITNWLRDDSDPEATATDDGGGWGLQLWWGAVVVGLFTLAISICNVPGDSGPAIAAPPTTAPVAPTTTLGVPLSPSDPNIPELIAGRSDLTFFSSLIEVTGLGEFIAINGVFTFFVPTDDVFATLPEDVRNFMLSDPNVANEVLQDHATFDALTAERLVDLGGVISVSQRPVVITAAGGAVMIDAATVIEADLPSSNGFVHVIDGLLGDPIEAPPTTTTVPPPPSVGNLLNERSDLSTMLAALNAARELELDFADEGFTLFAPTNDAFAALPGGSVEVLIATQPKLSELLGYHLVPGSVLAADLSDGSVITTTTGAVLPVAVADGVVTVGGVAVTETDLIGANGVVHIVEEVLIPPDFSLPTINEALSLEPITFETGSSVITPEGIEVLQGAVEFLAANPGVRVAIEGHTDSQGSEAENQALSEARAESVKEYLVSQGIAADRLETAGFGESTPIADNATPEGRAENRRIEFRLI